MSEKLKTDYLGAKIQGVSPEGELRGGKGGSAPPGPMKSGFQGVFRPQRVLSPPAQERTKILSPHLD